MSLKDQNRTGVFGEHAHMRFEGGGIRTDARMTIPAREALERVSTVRDGAFFYQRPPVGIVAVLAALPDDSGYETAFRCADEPPFPGEQPNPDMWVEVDLTPCPKCGSALVWYEAGYVPGYRVCAGDEHHHWIAAS